MTNPLIDMDNIIEKEFQAYLKRVGLKGKRMPASQLTEMRRAFFGASGQMLFLLDDIANIDEQQSKQAFESIRKEVKDFWTKECLPNN